MYTRHDELPTLSAWPSLVDARAYNAAFRAMRRARATVRVPIPGFSMLDLILQPGAWVVVDHNHNDMPVAAWTEFTPKPNRGVHEPVACELRYFHGAAGKVVACVRESVPDLVQPNLPALHGPKVVKLSSASRPHRHEN